MLTENIKIKRLLALCIDLINLIILFSVCIFLSQNLIINNFTSYKDLQNEANQILFSSGLYEKTEDGKYVFISSDIDNKLTIFYSKNPYNDLTNKTKSYEDAKIKSDLFEYDVNGKIIEKKDAKEEDLKEFYSDELNKANLVIANREDYKKLIKEINFIDTCNTFFTLLIICLIYFFILPLFNKNKVTIGNLILKLKLVSESNNKIGIIQLFMRFLAIFAIEILPSLTFYGATIIISLALMFFTNKSKTIHDYFALTYLEIDDHKKEQLNEEKTR